jgi:WhiB family redox-sensing transcriptional regulator
VADDWVTRLLAHLDPDNPWRHLAACRELEDKSLFFPVRGGNTHREALAVCHRCPVIAECLADALSLNANPEGIWGGTTRNQRTPMRRWPMASPEPGHP